MKSKLRGFGVIDPGEFDFVAEGACASSLAAPVSNQQVVNQPVNASNDHREAQRLPVHRID